MDASALVAAVTRHLGADERVRGLWLTGSMARGTDDAFSDVDLLVVVAEGSVQETVQDWLSSVPTLTPLVFEDRLDLGEVVVCHHITPEWLRFDVAFSGPGTLVGRSRTGVAMLLDRDDLTSHPAHAFRGAAQLAGRRPPSAVRRIVREFLRVLGLLPVALGRQDHVLAASGSALLRTLLVDLMTEAVEVEDRGGALHPARLLDPDHYETLRRLPPIEATRGSAVAVHQACADAFLPLAQHLCERTGVEWPEELARLAAGRVRSVAPG